ncbi:MAG: hypothetical protein J0M04_06450 [Verrucomicrobia bacterium]|nr:hypothetical protein [Verrucomicrobiota bacterium]
MTPTHQKKGRLRSSVPFLLGALTGAAIIAVSIITLGMSFGPSGFPLLPESARHHTEDVARLAPFPRRTSELSMASTGGPFASKFQISFFGDIDEISRWVSSCPGVQDPECLPHHNDDGSILYIIPQRPPVSEVSTSLLHHPDRGTVIVTVIYG